MTLGPGTVTFPRPTYPAYRLSAARPHRRAGEALTRTRPPASPLLEEFEELGVVLPSLRVDPVTAATREPYPLVELGRCNLNTAKRLADALHEARR